MHNKDHHAIIQKPKKNSTKKKKTSVENYNCCNLLKPLKQLLSNFINSN